MTRVDVVIRRHRRQVVVVASHGYWLVGEARLIEIVKRLWRADGYQRHVGQICQTGNDEMLKGVRLERTRIDARRGLVTVEGE